MYLDIFVGGKTEVGYDFAYKKCFNWLFLVNLIV